MITLYSSENVDVITDIYQRRENNTKGFVVQSYDNSGVLIDGNEYVALGWFYENTRISVKDIDGIYNAFEKNDSESLVLYSLRYAK